MPKSSRRTLGEGVKAARHDPLEKQIEETAKAASGVVDPNMARRRKKAAATDSAEAAAKKLQREERENTKMTTLARQQREEVARKAFKANRRMVDGAPFGGDDSESENDDEDEQSYMMRNDFEDMTVNQEDERALQRFMPTETKERRTLADIIMAKLQEKEAGDAAAAAGAEEEEQNFGGLSPQVVEVYTSIGKILSRYRAGKLPKAFKIIPSLRNWEDVLYLTDPDNWSPCAMRAATRIFASNLNPRMAQRFFALVLLPTIREDIRSEKKLNYHYYMALKKTTYKPAAFFKGIVLPLIDSGDCTLREAAIVGSVAARVRLPMMHSAAAMVKMAGMEYSGATSLFLRVLLDKKYSLPYKVIDSIAGHFAAFKDEKRQLPVLWHQALLVFAQRYKTNLTRQQKEALKPLLKVHFHRMITPEIRRELFQSVCRGETDKMAAQQRGGPMKMSLC